jgi:O-antigen ligase
MSSSVALPRNFFVLGVCLALAALLGYSLATPDAPSSILLVGFMVVVLTIPIFLRWHHALLILAWNATVVAFFLPGRPAVWMLFAGISLMITVLQCVLNKSARFQQVPAMTWPVLFLLVVVIGTAKLTGGIALRSFGGSSYGGKGYAFVLAAIIGYFALSSVRIPPHRAQLFSLLFFLSGITYAISNLAYVAGPGFWFLFAVFPVDYALGHAAADYGIGNFMRLTGLGFACIALCNVFLMRYGIRGVLDMTRPWRLAFFAVIVVASLFGGFRTTMAIITLTFAAQFIVEGLHRTRLLLVVVLGAVLTLAVIAPLASRLPLGVQRTLTVLPFLNVDHAVRANADASVEWRLEMWRILLPQVKEHLWLGKGYRIDPTELYLVTESVRRGLVEGHQGAIVTGDYHSGPLSVIVPFGILGVIGFAWILIAGTRVLYRNWRYGDASLRNVNMFLLAACIAKILFYIFVFGAFYTDLAVFLGMFAFSIALNGGMREAAAVPKNVPEPERAADLQPA